MNPGFSIKAFALSALLTIAAAPALAAACGTGTFEAWLEDFKKEAASKGISQTIVTTSLAGVTLDKAVLAAINPKRYFRSPLRNFPAVWCLPASAAAPTCSSNMVRCSERIEQTYGVPGEVIVAIWGLETDYGVNLGKFQTLRSLASLAYDCRRSDLFKAELMDALRIVERGDIPPQDLRSAWAGEIGQTQFMPSNYIKYAVDFDGNGKRDLLRSVPDVLASTANYLASKGWQRGKDWEPGSANFAVIKEWNKSEVYSKTIGYFAGQLARAP